jgi:hypothetical protein
MAEGSTISYLLGDHLGSTSLTLNSSGTRVAELRYKPWGEIRQRLCLQDTTVPLPRMATLILNPHGSGHESTPVQVKR